MAGFEKRKERRIKIVLPIKVIYQGSELSGFTGNISRLGTYAEVERELPIGSDVNVILEIPAYGQDASLGGKAKCRGNVFRSNFIQESKGKKNYGLGVFFTSFNEEADRQKLSRYIDYLVAREENEVKRDAKQWKEKREIKKTDRDLREGHDAKFNNSDIILLLKQIANQLEEIRSLLKPLDNSK